MKRIGIRKDAKDEGKWVSQKYERTLGLAICRECRPSAARSPMTFWKDKFMNPFSSMKLLRSLLFVLCYLYVD